VLCGRENERATLEQLLNSVRAGGSAALVLRGESGIGKTALLQDVIAGADGCRVIRAAGVESEMELAFAALHQMCAPLFDGLDRLPSPQRDALATAFGLSTGPPPDRFLIGLAVLSMLSDAADERPLVAVVDDAQWLDHASAEALSFVARRLHAESVLLLMAKRDPDGPGVLAGLPELRLGGLRYAHARELLASPSIGLLDEELRERVIAEAHGNPLALLELPRRVISTSLAGGFEFADGVPAAARVEASFYDQVAQLPEPTRWLLLVGAAEPVGDASLLWRAAGTLGIPRDAAAPAEAADLIEIGARVTFRHPVVRSAIYRGASPEERRTVHRALAEATDPELDADRRAWHRAHATLGADDDVALELERAAGRAKARGGVGAAGAFLEQSAALTPEPARRAGRALAAAELKLDAGAFDTAERLVLAAAAGPLDELQRARADRLRALIALAQQEEEGDVPLRLLAAARRLEPLDTTLARQTYLEALTAAFESDDRNVLLDTAHALRESVPREWPRPAELLLTGWAQLLSDGFPAGTDILRRALIAFRNEPLSDEIEIRGLWFACGIAKSLWDEESWRVVSQRYVESARRAGALAILPRALETRGELLVETGDFATAASLTAEAQEIAAATGNAGVRIDDTELWLSAWRNDERAAARLEAGAREAHRRADDWAIVGAEHAYALWLNGLGRSAEALAAAQRAAEHHPFQGSGRVLIELIEAASRAGQPNLAAAALERLSDRTRMGGTEWALGVEARMRALLADGKQAEALYQEAVERLHRTGILPERGRAHLVYGEWLRREKRRGDAREQLRAAHELFSTIGAGAFAERAGRELLATGEKVRARGAETRDQLTTQELHIARLAADGQTNSEIGAQLFLSPRTVEWHLSNVFLKLGLTSRKQLRRTFPDRLPV
jgi:DNA-binding CsgD family transcriptional regulator